MRSTFECRAVQNQLWDLNSGSLPEDRQKQIRSHVEGCAACQQQLQAIAQTMSALDAARHGSIPESRLGWHDLARRIESPGLRRRPALRMLPVGAGLGAAVLCAAAGLLFINIKADRAGLPEPIQKSSQPHQKSGGFGGLSAEVATNSTEDEKSLLSSGIADLQTGGAVAGPALRMAPPASGRARAVRPGLRLASHSGSYIRPASAADEAEYPDGDSPRQNLRSDYVLQSASSGNDEEQNRRYVIDVVSTRTIASTEGTEDVHPW
jgi:Putative zinc-finger